MIGARRVSTRPRATVHSWRNCCKQVPLLRVPPQTRPAIRVSRLEFLRTPAADRSEVVTYATSMINILGRPSYII